jgi:hypothetical protein
MSGGPGERRDGGPLIDRQASAGYLRSRGMVREEETRRDCPVPWTLT